MIAGSFVFSARLSIVLAHSLPSLKDKGVWIECVDLHGNLPWNLVLPEHVGQFLESSFVGNVGSGYCLQRRHVGRYHLVVHVDVIKRGFVLEDFFCGTWSGPRR